MELLCMLVSTGISSVQAAFVIAGIQVLSLLLGQLKAAACINGLAAACGLRNVDALCSASGVIDAGAAQSCSLHQRLGSRRSCAVQYR